MPCVHTAATCWQVRHTLDIHNVFCLMLNGQEGTSDSEIVVAVFTRFYMFLPTQQLSKLCDLLRESGDFLVTNSMVGSVETDPVFTKICCLHWQVLLLLLLLHLPFKMIGYRKRI